MIVGVEKKRSKYCDIVEFILGCLHYNQVFKKKQKKQKKIKSFSSFFGHYEDSSQWVPFYLNSPFFLRK